ncbi:exocyst complex component sec3 domain-containing protein [Ditylenchus destructor]|uniref:Exocyst complex component sec3 domain-containing protein n=1 Tax=Ditylenchus destructor TaxID=166010 RepID=A0AAD4R5D8_9BILA|nr:exocyst complex component sec3 domain-containing protein [Ditylenchus destructor]
MRAEIMRKLLDLVEEAMEEVAQIEDRLEEYEGLLTVARKNIDHIEANQRLESVELRNKQRLYETLSDCIQKLENKSEEPLAQDEDLHLAEMRKVSQTSTHGSAQSRKTSVSSIGQSHENLASLYFNIK